MLPQSISFSVDNSFKLSFLGLLKFLDLFPNKLFC